MCFWRNIIFLLLLKIALSEDYEEDQQDDGDNYHKLLSLNFVHDIENYEKQENLSEIPDQRILREETTEVECHRIALHRCGSIFIKVFRLLDFLPENQSFQPRCTLRSAFFSCLQKDKEKLCKKHRGNFTIDDKFRKKMADLLWSTRVCVLGLNLNLQN